MVIVFKNEDDSVGIIRPTLRALEFFTIQQIAEKDVPAGLPYWVVKPVNIPKDRTFRDAWEVNPELGDPHGFGGENNQFDAELLKKWRKFIGGEDAN